jgi:hypothetical protein
MEVVIDISKEIIKEIQSGDVSIETTNRIIDVIANSVLEQTDERH